MKAARPTIRDVAKLADVSIAAVSHVVNQSRELSQQTQQKVQAVIELLCYTPNVDPRNLARMRGSRANSVSR
jgi:DNA-binding LacI/PurR family transcriptional regulator